MVKIERKALICAAMFVMAISAPVVASLQSVTVASFADPSGRASEPLFVVDYDLGTFNGGWASTGLTLEVPIANATYYDVTFTMDELNFSGGNSADGYDTTSGPYAIHFLDGSTEVLTIEFQSAWIQSRNAGLDAQDFCSDDVTISGVGFGGLSVEHFGFSFVNVVHDGNSSQATASFESSAVPEPTTIAILGFGGLFLGKCRRSK